MEESRERPRDGAKGRGGEKEVKGRKSLKKVLQYGQKSTNCLFSHIKGGAKRLYLRRAEHLEQRSIAPREGEARLTE